MKQLKLFINNSWVDSSTGATIVSKNPSTGESIAILAEASRQDVDMAVAAAKAAFNSGVWSDMDPDERADIMVKAAGILRRRADELAEWEAKDVGKPLTAAKGVDIAMTIHAMEYFAHQSRAIHGAQIPLAGNKLFDWTTYQPYGVVAVVSPWNFPLHLATRSLCPAIATGNTVVLKPSSLAPITSVLLGEILVEAGVPAGVVNVVTGPGSSVGDQLIRHRDVSLLCLTGSVDAGRRFLEASAQSPVMKKTLLELRGKGPFIAEADCDIEGAVNSACMGFAANQGEICCASTRLFLHDGIYDEFMAKLVRRTNSLKMGDIMDPATQVGSLISLDELERVNSCVQSAVAEGARLVCGGERYLEPPCDKGAYYRPTILERVTNDMTCAREEIFGPVLSVIRYRELDDALKMANDSAYGLGATIWSSDIRKLHKASRKLDAGMVWMNTNLCSQIEAPFGGNKNSGMGGREDGRVGLMEYLKVKNNVLFVGEEYDNYFGFTE